ncbi:hypothetical protein [Halobacterium yunchengense]|uniref:hypothetical protein n=1 Tax=Halobacterium yunchengense TaxID=3108497 RepID=UPI00300A101E
MLERLFAAVGVAEILFPEAVVEFGERLAAADAGALERKPWVVAAARAEGVLWLFFAWRSERAFSAFKLFLGAVGAALALAPRRFVDWSTALGYENPEDVEWRSWTYPLTRAVGVLYALVGLREWRRRCSRTGGRP